MPVLTPLIYEVRNKNGELIFSATHDFLAQQAEAHKVPHNEYVISAPFVGKTSRVFGVAHREKYMPQLIEALTICINLSDKKAPLTVDDRRKLEQRLAELLKVYSVSSSILNQLYFNIVMNSLPIDSFKQIFTYLEREGATWNDLLEKNLDATGPGNRDTFTGLFTKVLNQDTHHEALSNHLASIGFRDLQTPSKTGFSVFKKEVPFYLSLGAHLNGVSITQPEHGTFLHQYLAYEFPFGKDLIEFLHSVRKEGNPKTHFDFSKPDGLQRTPLMIAIVTRNEKAAIALLLLSLKEKIDIGIELSDPKGRTPLLLAAVYGLPMVLQMLLRQKANPHHRDHYNRTYQNFLTFSEGSLRDEINDLVHPDRDKNVNHSFLHDIDSGSSPFCLYPDTLEPVSGDGQSQYFCVLSKKPEHFEKLTSAVTYLKTTLKTLNGSKKLTQKHQDLLSTLSKRLNYVDYQINELSGVTFLEACQAGQAKISAWLTTDAAQTLIQSIAKPKHVENHLSSLRISAC